MVHSIYLGSQKWCKIQVDCVPFVAADLVYHFAALPAFHTVFKILLNHFLLVFFSRTWRDFVSGSA